MAEDPLAVVIAEAAKTARDAVAPRHPLPTWLPEPIADAVRAHIAANYISKEDIAAALDAEEAWFGFTRQDPYSKGLHDGYDRVRAALLGTTEEAT